MPVHTLPLRGAHHPSSTRAGTSPGSFANPADVGGPRTYSSPDTPGMPAPSDKTAWDFLPDGWTRDARTGFALAPAGFVPSPSSSTRASARSRPRCSTWPTSARRT
jgi:phosphomethylpyrimidine synthase